MTVCLHNKSIELLNGRFEEGDLHVNFREGTFSALLAVLILADHEAHEEPEKEKKTGSGAEDDTGLRTFG